ncbi:MAG: hypothetical protein ABIQ16_02885 [Polyangiaceae bacterium]
MGRARLLWLLLPIAGLVELALFVVDAHRAPRVAEWQALRAEVAKLKAQGDLVVVAPEWAEPLAREAFGDALMPISDLARPDVSAYARAIEVDELGASAPELDGWRVAAERTVGRFKIRTRENPKPAEIKFSFIDQAHPPQLEVGREGEGEACAFTKRAQSSAGGLHGHLAFPRERYVCGGAEEHFVGVTILDDQAYRPRRCLWVEPPGDQPLHLSFKNVAIGRQIYGYAGLSYFLFRDGKHGPTTIRARVAGQDVGRYEHHDETGWHGFQFDTARFAGQTADVEFIIQSDDPYERQLCFYADTR